MAKSFSHPHRHIPRSHWLVLDLSSGNKPLMNAHLLFGFLAHGMSRLVKRPGRPRAATRPTGRNDGKRNEPAGLDAMKG